MKKYLLILSTAFYSCATYIPYTDKIKNDLKDNGIEVEQTQFYFNESITLERKTEQTNIKTKKGNIEREKDQVRDIIKFTPDLMDKAIGEKLTGIGKETNGDIEIFFEPEKGIKLNRCGEYYCINSISGILFYDEERYMITKGNNNKAYILKKDYYNYSQNTRKVKGMRVGQ